MPNCSINFAATATGCIKFSIRDSLEGILEPLFLMFEDSKDIDFVEEWVHSLSVLFPSSHLNRR